MTTSTGSSGTYVRASACDPDLVAHGVGQRGARGAEHAGLALDGGHVGALLRGEVRQHAGTAAEVKHMHAGAHDVGDGFPEGVHPVLVQQHLGVVLQRDDVGR